MLAKSVKRLLSSRLGRDVVLKREDDGSTYDVTTGSTTGGSETTETFRGAFTNYNQDEVDGTRITEKDSKLLLQGEGSTMVPQTGDLVDDTYRIVRARKIEDGSGVIGYICQVRA
jgi:hypothetical protein